MSESTKTGAAQPREPRMEVVHPHAAGLDIGATEIWACVPQGHAAQPVRTFGTYTPDLSALADWLTASGVNTVAMESTGVYWVPIYDLLEARGVEVYLVNPRQAKQVPGRKSDLKDCQWLQRLHTFGLLSASFHPAAAIRPLRTLARHRAGLLAERAMQIQHLQAALHQMNLQLTQVLSDVTGVTGLAILRALAAGERDPHKLAQWRDPRCAKTEAEIVKALTGHYRDEWVFVVQQALALYDTYTQQLGACDAQIEQRLRALPAAGTGGGAGTGAGGPAPAPPTLTRKPGSHSKNAPAYDLQAQLARLSGVDLLAVPGFGELTAQTILTEVGTDMSPWPSEKHFCAWLHLAPSNDISGGRVLRSRLLPTANRAAQAFRLAAQSAGRGATALGAYYRRLQARLGPKQAVVATAHKLARIVYRMLKAQVPYQELGAAEYERRQKERDLTRLQRQAAAYGFVLTPQPAPGG